MTSEEARNEELLDRLVLEIKAIALLYGSESELRAKLEGEIMESHDENVRKFVKALQSKRPVGTGKLVAMALGELLMASLLVVGATIVLFPTVAGVNTLAGLVQYFAERASGGLIGSPLSPYLSFVEFALGVALMLSSFFALREAASKLKEAGLTIKPGESQ